MSDILSIAIIGTAGRKEDAVRLDLSKYKEMKMLTRKLIYDICNKNKDKYVQLVSGGAAYADFLAVDLYWENQGYLSGNYDERVADLKLKLCLPCDWNSNTKKFEDNGEFNFKTNPGGTTNYYHRLFEQNTGIKSLEIMDEAIRSGAEVIVKPGLFERNSEVAKTDCLIALTFGVKEKVKSGGTADTVSKWLNLHKESDRLGFHINLSDMTIYDNIKT